MFRETKGTESERIFTRGERQIVRPHAHPALRLMQKMLLWIESEDDRFPIPPFFPFTLNPGYFIEGPTVQEMRLNEE